jgi:hypothetical protein
MPALWLSSTALVGHQLQVSGRDWMWAADHRKRQRRCCLWDPSPHLGQDMAVCLLLLDCSNGSAQVPGHRRFRVLVEQCACNPLAVMEGKQETLRVGNRSLEKCEITLHRKTYRTVTLVTQPFNTCLCQPQRTSSHRRRGVFNKALRSMH